MQQAARNVYASMQKEGLSGRALEAQVLSRAANMLKECQHHWDEDGHKERLDAAIRFNQKVWSFFQAELSDPENPMPKEIKQNLLSLSVFIDRRLLELLLTPVPEMLTAIININMNIAAGLMEKPKGESGAQVVQPSSVAFTA